MSEAYAPAGPQSLGKAASAVPARAGVQAIVDRLEEEIALGRLRPRERLLEEEISTFFDAKRHVVRQALVELEAMGIVVRQPNRGAAVRDYTAKEVEQIHVVREMLERQATLLMPLPPPEALLEELKAVHARHSDAVERGDLRTVFRENLRFHRLFFGACGNPHLAALVDQAAQKAHAIRSYAIGITPLLAQMRDEHAAMIDCLKQGDRDRLVELVRKHIQPARDAYFAATPAMGLGAFRDGRPKQP